MTRRSRTLTLLAALACGIGALGGGPVGAAPSPSAAEQRDANGLLGLVGVDHVGLTVPDIDEAVAWFEDVLGCSAPLTFGPFADPTGTFMQDLLDVDPRAVIEQITTVRCGRSANIELFEYEAPDQRTTFPKNSDWAGHHRASPRSVPRHGCKSSRRRVCTEARTTSRAICCSDSPKSNWPA